MKKKELKEYVTSLAAQGFSRQEIALDLFRNDPMAMLFEQEEFEEAWRRAAVLSQGWWEEQGRLNLKTKGFSAVLWSKNMSGRFGGQWASAPIEVNNTNNNKIDILTAIKQADEANKKATDRLGTAV